MSDSFFDVERPTTKKGSSKNGKSDKLYPGGGWRMESHNGQPYISVSFSLEKLEQCIPNDKGNISLAMFPNGRKRDDKNDPDYVFVWSPAKES